MVSGEGCPALTIAWRSAIATIEADDPGGRGAWTPGAWWAPRGEPDPGVPGRPDRVSASTSTSIPLGHGELLIAFAHPSWEDRGGEGDGGGAVRLFRAVVPVLGLAFLALPQPASALSLTLSGPTVGPLVGGTGSESAAVGTQVTFTVGLDAAPSVNGYDVTIAWDAIELAFLSASDLSGLGFDVAPAGTTASGERVAAIALQAVATASLFSVSFDVLAPLGDGLRDFEVLVIPATNGSGIAPGTLSLANGAAGVGIDVVPEPGSAALLAGALAALAALRRGARTRRL